MMPVIYKQSLMKNFCVKTFVNSCIDSDAFLNHSSQNMPFRHSMRISLSCFKAKAAGI
jgi:hypothetical protein